MNKKQLSVGIYIIISALIWGGAMVWCAHELKGTPFKEKITHILTGGVLMHFIAVWLPITLLVAKLKKKHEKDEEQKD